jgi:hypothetical protein
MPPHGGISICAKRQSPEQKKLGREMLSSLTAYSRFLMSVKQKGTPLKAADPGNGKETPCSRTALLLKKKPSFPWGYLR